MALLGSSWANRSFTGDPLGIKAMGTRVEYHSPKDAGDQRHLHKCGIEEESKVTRVFIQKCVIYRGVFN